MIIIVKHIELSVPPSDGQTGPDITSSSQQQQKKHASIYKYDVELWLGGAKTTSTAIHKKLKNK